MTRVWSARKEGFVDAVAKLVISPRFDQSSEFSEGYARIWRTMPGGGRYGYIDKTGKVVIEPRFATDEAFSDGFALVKEGEAQAFIDTTGRVTLTPRYQRVYSSTSGRRSSTSSSNSRD